MNIGKKNCAKTHDTEQYKATKQKFQYSMKVNDAYRNEYTERIEK